ncbi:type VI secretion system secreted protein VgrG [Silvimonas terrae]|uniref:Type VI secretion system secreted protein VgrG n=1 Tax=Silvimonas terrae TaxID=300266 RepID=A0A840RDY5_9NEIS|nr:type VI secretion system tip protein VgrG [Silvimonas terrae]MBB5190646.1 type VI secretion system secreted protein VgrG [Silvimonas terrae]
MKFDDLGTSLVLSAPALAGLVAASVTGREEIQAVNAIALSGLAEVTQASADAIAKPVTLKLQNDAQTRPFGALVAEIRQLPTDATANHYQLTLRPWLWWLTLASNNRIFQNQKTQDILTAVFQGNGFSDYQFSLTGSYTPREYCVQYGETDFAFVCRLMEEDGIFYFFTHEDGKHTLVLADNNEAFPQIPNGPKVPYMGQEIGVRELHGIRSAQYAIQAVTGAYSATDYQFTTPTSSLYSQAQAVASAPAMYEHPGSYVVKATGDTLTKQRIDGLRSQEKRLIGESDCRWLVPGHWFTLTGHDDDALNMDWVVTSVMHEASHDHYRNRFEAMPKATPYRPARVTPKPRMHPQTAVVVGKAGEEIWTDEYGRIKIQFPWDRDGANDEKSSCWVRVVMPWTGKGFGIQFIPRIGQEVIVTFIDGDPDRPLVTGCVYNGDNALPYALPANQTQSGIKTNSSKGGGGFNELRFEDKKDSEEVFMQAQKDLKVNVLNDATHTIGHDETRTVKNARTHTIQEADDSVTVQKGNRSLTVSTGNETVDIKANRTVKAGGDETRTVGGNLAQTVTGNYTLTVDGNLTIKVSGTLSIESTGAFSGKSDAALSLQAGTSMSSKAGTSLENQAGTSLTNRAGTTMTNDAGVSLTNKGGAEQTVDGGGMLTLKGGIVKIN